jgi:hypothetical protein
VFSIREAAAALVLLSQGMSLRGASLAARDKAERKRLDRWQRVLPSPHGQLGADLVSLFGDAIARAYLPTEWPDVIGA